MALEQFKAMVKLDRHNEVHPSKRRRKSNQKKPELQEVEEISIEQLDDKETKSLEKLEEAEDLEVGV